jgi:hypothetical protein
MTQKQSVSTAQYLYVTHRDPLDYEIGEVGSEKVEGAVRVTLRTGPWTEIPEKVIFLITFQKNWSFIVKYRSDRK